VRLTVPHFMSVGYILQRTDLIATVSDRAALNGILFVMKTGMRWNHLPTRLGFGSGVTCWRRLPDWQEAGVWGRLYELCGSKHHDLG
jgi:transposase